MKVAELGLHEADRQIDEYATLVADLRNAYLPSERIGILSNALRPAIFDSVAASPYVAYFLDTNQDFASRFEQARSGAIQNREEQNAQA